MKEFVLSLRAKFIVNEDTRYEFALNKCKKINDNSYNKKEIVVSWPSHLKMC